ncbi:hypothetical protein CC2G_004429 [Coprinopsis cinerea AmutBmut pab1-1]|nr:hypothetical protein CC2G_004429 [Coprinopsis cinerea AmutBmut pab1-1]
MSVDRTSNIGTFYYILKAETIKESLYHEVKGGSPLALKRLNIWIRKENSVDIRAVDALLSLVKEEELPKTTSQLSEFLQKCPPLFRCIKGIPRRSSTTPPVVSKILDQLDYILSWIRFYTRIFSSSSGNMPSMAMKEPWELMLALASNTNLVDHVLSSPKTLDMFVDIWTWSEDDVPLCLARDEYHCPVIDFFGKYTSVTYGTRLSKEESEHQDLRLEYLLEYITLAPKRLTSFFRGFVTRMRAYPRLISRHSISFDVISEQLWTLVHGCSILSTVPSFPKEMRKAGVQQALIWVTGTTVRMVQSAGMSFTFAFQAVWSACRPYDDPVKAFVEMVNAGAVLLIFTGATWDKTFMEEWSLIPKKVVMDGDDCFSHLVGNLDARYDVLQSVSKECLQLCDNPMHFSRVQGPWGKPMTCSRCHCVVYCSLECQKEDWLRRHRNECRTMRSTHIVQQTNHGRYSQFCRAYHVKLAVIGFNKMWKQWDEVNVGLTKGPWVTLVDFSGQFQTEESGKTTHIDEWTDGERNAHGCVSVCQAMHQRAIDLVIDGREQPFSSTRITENIFCWSPAQRVSLVLELKWTGDSWEAAQSVVRFQEKKTPAGEDKASPSTETIGFLWEYPVRFDNRC